MNRREFIRNLGYTSAGAAVLAACPWLGAAAKDSVGLGERLNVGIIGPGSRGQFLMRWFVQNPKANIVALCDDYEPSLAKALEMAPSAQTYSDYRKLLERDDIQAVVIATPPHLHAKMTLDAFEAGKHVLVEKSMSIYLDEALAMYQAHKRTGKVMFVGQQRLFSPLYIKMIQDLHTGDFGRVQAIRMHWDRNANWRRPVPSPELERKINWRLYKEYSRGIMTELACHQLQVGNWAMRSIPNRIMGRGAIVARNDGREVYDNVTAVYEYDNGVPMSFFSTHSNKFYGMEEQILCEKGTIEPERGKFYYESIPPAPAFLRMVNKAENDLFDSIPFAGTSWAPETANTNKGEYIMGKRARVDGTSLMIDTFIDASISGEIIPGVAEEGYYSTMLSLLGHQAMEERRVIDFPDKYKLDYLNHKKQ